jgi:hypothetical protein
MEDLLSAEFIGAQMDFIPSYFYALKTNFHVTSDHSSHGYYMKGGAPRSR